MKKEMTLKKAETIFEYYGIEKDKKPLVLFGQPAKEFYKNHLKSRGLSSIKAYLKMKKTNGIFLYEDLDIQYIKENLATYLKKNGFNEECYKNGVVCLFRNSIATLAHEIRHAYQLQHEDLNEFMMIEKSDALMYLYNKFYVYYPNEQDAFYLTLQYLKAKESKFTYLSYLFKISTLEVEYSWNAKSLHSFKHGIVFNSIKKKLKLGKVDIKPLDIKNEFY